jgi:tetratricopeptide (TPR) repeat protein
MEHIIPPLITEYLKAKKLIPEDITTSLDIENIISTISLPSLKALFFFELTYAYYNFVHDKELSKSFYKKGLLINPDNYPLGKRLQKIFEKIDLDFSLELLLIQNEIIQNEITKIEIFYNIAKIYEKKQDIKKSIYFYENALKLKPDHVDSLISITNLYINLSEYDKAKFFTSALSEYINKSELKINHVKILFELGKLNYRLDEIDRAIIRFKTTFDLDSNFFPSYEELSNIYIETENYSECLLLLKNFIKYFPLDNIKNARLFYKIGVCEENLGDFNNALTNYYKCLQLDQYFSECNIKLASLLFNMGQYTEAYKYYSNLQIDALDIKIQIDINQKIARCLLHIPRREKESIIYLEKILKIIPDNYDQNMFANIYYALGEIYKNIFNDNIESVKYFKKTINIYSKILLKKDDLSIRINLANCNAEVNGINSVLGDYESILLANPYNIDLYKYLSSIFIKNKLFDRAYVYNSIISILEPNNEYSRKYIKDYRDKINQNSQISITKELREKYLLHPFVKNLVRNILNEVYDLYETMFPVNLKYYGITSDLLESDFINKSIKEPFLKTCKLLSSAKIKLLLAFSGKLGIYPENTRPPSVIFHQEVINSLSDLELKFFLGKSIEHIINNNSLYRKFTQDKLKYLIDIICHAINKTYKIKKIDNKDFLKIAKNFKFPRNFKKEFTQLINEYIKIKDQINIENYIQGMEHTANRAGLIACNDLESAITAIIKFDKKLSKINYSNQSDLSIIFKKSSEITELIKFSISNDYFELRKKLGIAIT